MAHGDFAVGEVLTAANLNAHTIPNNAIAVADRTGANQVISGGTTTTVVTADVLDPRGWHASGVYTPDIAGWYYFHAEVHWSADSDYTRLAHILSKNASTSTIHFDSPTADPGSSGPDFTLSAFFAMNGTTDTLELKVLQSNTDGSTEAILTGTRTVLKFMYPT